MGVTAFVWFGMKYGSDFGGKYHWRNRHQETIPWGPRHQERGGWRISHIVLDEYGFREAPMGGEKTPVSIVLQQSPTKMSYSHFTKFSICNYHDNSNAM